MKKVLFTGAINPYNLADNLYPPLWPAYLVAYSERYLPPQSVEFRWGAGPITSLLDRHRPDVLAISSVTQNYGYAEQYALEAKKRGIRVIVGGMHISSLPQSLSPEMDVACLGEGEQTFTELLQLFLATGRFDPADLRRIPGIAFGDGIQTESRSTSPRIEDLPHPKRALIGYGHRAYVHTARGCAYRCVFCSAARYWGNVRYAPAEYVMEELDELVSHGVRIVRFADDNFVSHVPRLLELAEKIQQRGFHKRLRFSCWCRANNVTPEVVRTLRAMNVVSVKLGLESGSKRILDYLKGGVTVEQNRRAVTWMKEGGMQVNADFLFGTPDETEEEMLQTYQFIRQSPIDFFDINIFSPLPNTPVWDLARRRGLINEKHMDWSRLNYKFIGDRRRAIHLSEKLDHAQLKRVHARFQRLRKWHTLRSTLKSPWLSELPGLAARTGWLRMQSWIHRVRYPSLSRGTGSA
jgi:anaerobic magnesium-protoporphyrin IX monomethyl ester cyclase